MESSRRDLFIDMVVDRFIFRNNQVALSPCFTLTGMKLPRTGVVFIVSYERLSPAQSKSEVEAVPSALHDFWCGLLKSWYHVYCFAVLIPTRLILKLTSSTPATRRNENVVKELRKQYVNCTCRRPLLPSSNFYSTRRLWWRAKSQRDWNLIKGDAEKRFWPHESYDRIYSKPCRQFIQEAHKKGWYLQERFVCFFKLFLMCF